MANFTANINPSDEDLKHIAQHLRQPDIDELAALAMVNPLFAIRDVFNKSTFKGVIYLQDEPICVMGIQAKSFTNTREGVPWLLGTEKINQHRVGYMRMVLRYFKEYIPKFEYLENYVYAENVESIVFLEFLGFKIHQPAELYGVKKLPFYRFSYGDKR